MINFINRESELAQLEIQYAADSGSLVALCAPQLPPFPLRFLLLFIDIGSILNHPDRHEKHYTRH